MFGGEHRKHHLDATEKVAGHPVGARQKDLRILVGPKHVDPAVLQKPVDDAADTDRLAQSRHARSEAADAAGHDVDWHPRLAGLVERLDHAVVDQRVELGEDPRRLPRLGPAGLLLDQLDRAAVQVVGGHDQPLPGMPLRIAGQQVEEGRGILGHRLVGREQAEVGVGKGRGGVVVAGAEVDVPPQRLPLLPHHHRDFAVRLEVEKAEHHVHAGPLHLPRPAHVVGLVKSRLELHEGRDVLARLGRRHQRAGDRRVAAGAIERLLDRKHPRIGGG